MVPTSPSAALSRSGGQDRALSPIFIVSPTSKSGTNFLLNVLVELKLARIPDVDPLTREDHLLYHADLLRDYAEKTAAIWDEWESSLATPADNANRLLRHLGEGLLQLFGSPGGLPMIVKTPASRNLQKAPVLFPEARFLLLVRDGRDATESGVLSGYWESYEEAFAAWAQGVRDLLAFTRGSGAGTEGTRWTLLRYERLAREPGRELLPTLGLLGAGPEAVDISVIDALPVFGSTDYGIGTDGEFEWRTARRTESFRPIGRWHGWSRSTKDLFKRLAGEELVALGYEEESSSW